MSTGLPALIGRDAECDELERLVEAVGNGESRTLVVHGEPGVGKTALLDYLAARASDSGCRIVGATGVQSEMEFAFAALHQVCAPLLEQLEAIPEPQRDALATTFGLSVGPAPDRFLVGLATLSLLAEAAVDRPLVGLVDDEQWLDRASAQALTLAARRLGAESVGLVFGARVPSAELAGLPELVVSGLRDNDARALLAAAWPGPMDARARDHIIIEANGNPLTLVELPRGLTPSELAGGFGLPGAMALPASIEESFRRRSDGLPAAARRLLVLAAAEPLGDPALVRRAASALGIGGDAEKPAADAGLVELDAQVKFRHPLVRSAAYRSASAQERRLVHAALAEATDPVVDPDRRAWHRAQAAPEPDEDVAAELDRCASRAQARGGLAAAAAFLSRATALTPDHRRRAGRALHAARAMHHAGQPEAALDMLTLAEAGPDDLLQRAEVDLLRAHVRLTMTRGGDTVTLLLGAARRLEPLNPGLARETYLDALMAAMFAGHLATESGVLDAARAARAAPPPVDEPLPADFLLDGLAVRFTDGYAAAIPMLRRALAAFRERDLTSEELRWLWLAHITAGGLWDEQTLDTIHHVDVARGSGALATLPLALATRIGAHVLMGDLASAQLLLEEMNAVTEATGIPTAPYGALLLAAWKGHEADVVELIDATTTELLRRGEGFGLIITGFAKAMLCNSLSRHGDAVSAAELARGYPAVMGVEPWGLLVELIEGASRTRQTVLANGAFQDLADVTRAAGSDWALGIEARSRALLSDGAEAEAAYMEAIDRLARTKIRGELARAHLLYGEWLRRKRRRTDARSQLRAAHIMFTDMGMDAFAERARRELRATGETARKRSVETRSALTAQEAEVAKLAREGLSNPEIGAHLFISARTVQYHLSKVFAKLGITSRAQLAAVL